MTKPKLMVLGGGKQQIAVYLRAKKMGVAVIGVDPDSQCPCGPLADVFYHSDLRDVAEILTIARNEQIDGVLTAAADYPIPSVAAVASELGLPGISRTCAQQCTDKVRMRQCLKEAGIGNPNFEVCEDAASLYRALRASANGVVVKATSGSGSRGIQFLAPDASNEDIAIAFQTALEHSSSRQVLAEEFMQGAEFSVESISVGRKPNIVAVSSKRTSGPPQFVEVGHDVPAQISRQSTSAIAECARDAVVALGIEDSAAHTEIILVDREPKIVEVGARLGGGFINSDLVPLATGVDILAAAIDVALGRIPDLTPTRDRGASIRFLQPQPGIVQEIIDHSINNNAGIVRKELWISIGDRTGPLRDSGDRIGFVISQARDSSESARSADFALSEINIRMSAL